MSFKQPDTNPFESEVSKSLKLLQDVYSFWYIKLVDTHAFEFNLYCPYCHGKWQSPLIIPKSIGDFLVANDNGCHFLEVKSTHNARYYPINFIAPHQLSWGLQLSTYEHISYDFLICDRSISRANRSYLLNVVQLDDLIAQVHPRKSILWSYFDNYEQAPLTTGKIWDLSNWLESIGTRKV